MKTTINYTTNTQLWKMEGIAEAHGYTKTADCYWTQIFTNANGDQIVTVREDVCGNPVEEFRSAVRPAAEDLCETIASEEVPVAPKTLYFEGAGWSGADISKATVGNCRIRTAFHLDDGRAVYLEIIACEVTKRSPATWQSFKYAGFVDDCHVIHNDGTKEYMASFAPFEYSHPGILQMVNSLGASFDAVEVLPDLAGYRVHADHGGYHYADEFAFDRDLLAARQTIDEQIRAKEIARGEKSICYSLWVDSEDPAILHYKNFRTGENFDICVAHPNDPEKLPVLHKSNAIIGGYYAGCGYLLKVYRITEEYAERYDLMYLDRCEVSNYGDCALGGSDVYRRKSPRV